MRRLAEPGAASLERTCAKVLVFLIGSLGDTVIALPSFYEVRRRCPNSRIVLLTNSPVDGGVKAASTFSVLGEAGLADEVIEYPHGRASLSTMVPLALHIRAAGIRQGFYLMQRRTRMQLLRDGLFFRLCGISCMHGLRLNPPLHLAPRSPDGLWESEARRMLRSIGVTRPSLDPADFALNLTVQERSAAAREIRSAGVTGDYLVVCAGTKVDVKDWGEERWTDFVERAASALPPMALVLIGSADEALRAARLAARWPRAATNLCGRLSPRQSAAVIEGARLFVGHDSGPMHLAAAVGTRTISIFSSREMPGIWFPNGQEQGVFYADVPCRDCRLDICREHNKRCIASIDPADVAERAVRFVSPASRAAA